MRRARFAAIAAAASFAFACGAAAADARWYLQVDNDALLDTDRWYSSGLRIARVMPCDGFDLEMGLVQEIYSPEGERFVFGMIDRAPAARLLASVARHDRGPDYLQTLELAAGVRGPAAQGEPVTDFIHRFVSASEIVWSRQEPNRFDAHVAGVRSHDRGPVRVHYGAVLGNEVAFAHLGAELRFGQPGPSSPALRYAPTPPWGAGAGWGGFVGASVRGVMRNEMLVRPYSFFGAELERRKAVGRAAAGVAWTGNGFAVNAALVAETREFEGQRAVHGFASVTLHAGF